MYKEKPIVPVVVVLIENREKKILLLKRAPDNKWAPNLWNIISGHIENKEEPTQAALREIKEEVAMNVELKEKFPVYDVDYDGKIWRTYAYKFLTDDLEPKLNIEHSEFRWVSISEMSEFNLVPILYKDLEKMGYL